ncbi:MAG: UUP1 family membrane protein, partial [Ketobacter sp.]|nr:UUP1 family membrane protein [Ketobacter sp.]
MRLFQILLIAAVCSFVGLSVFLYKVMVLEFPLQSNAQTRSWHLEATMEFTGRGKPVKAQLFLPRPSSSHSIVDENFISNGYGFSSEIEKERGNRVAQWTKRKVNGRDII